MKESAIEALDAANGYLAGSISLLARDLHRLFNRVLEERVGQFGLGFHTCRYLGIIAEHGSATPTELSKYLGVRQPTTLSALRALQTKGLVRKTNDETDGRKSQYRLTGKGVEIEAIIRNSALEMEQLICQKLTEKQLYEFKEVVLTILSCLDNELGDQSARGI